MELFETEIGKLPTHALKPIFEKQIKDAFSLIYP
jgi:hypothetical protein